MSGIFLAQPTVRAVDANGAPMNGAKLQFYLTGTTTPANVFTTNALSTPLSNPVVSDSAGLFPPIYLDSTVIYRAQLQTGGGSLVMDIDPVNGGYIEATQVQVDAGLATGVYVSPAKLAAWTGVAAALGYAPLNRAGDTATNLMIVNTSLAATSAGYLGLPVNEQDGAYGFALADAGRLVRANSATGVAWTLPANASVAFPVGAVIAVRNAGAGVVTLTRTSGVSLTIAGSGTSKDVGLAQYGLASLIQESANSWVAAGQGLS